jgi:hypothetical protein
MKMQNAEQTIVAPRMALSPTELSMPRSKGTPTTFPRRRTPIRGTQPRLVLVTFRTAGSS